MRANDSELVPAHYSSTYLHWDLVISCGMGYFDGCATKYVSRWRKKDGIKDLKKGLHFLNKLEESRLPAPERKMFDKELLREVNAFAEANKLTDLERAFVRTLSMRQAPEELAAARELLFLLLDEAEALEKGAKPVPLTEENHHAERAERNAD